jgi:hypothetical protein
VDSLPSGEIESAEVGDARERTAGMLLQRAMSLILAISFIGMSADEASARRKPWQRALSVVVSGGTTIITQEAAKKTEPLAAKAAEAAGLPPEKAKEVLRVGADPLPSIIELGEKTTAHYGKTTIEAIKAKTVFVEAIAQGDLRKMGEAFVQIAGVEVDKALSPGVIYVVDLATASIPLPFQSGLMEEPEILIVEPDNTKTKSPGIVYYVNGMLTPKDSALAEAKALANRLVRTVGLIHNTSHNKQEDSMQSIYDRAWPIALRSTALIPNGRLSQTNKTTRQVTHLLRHSASNVSIVSHSQGCLIVRNALVTASRIRGYGDREKRVRWVATGTPLRNEEIHARVNRYTPLANRNDFVAQGLGLRLVTQEEDQKNRSSGHDFVHGYVDQIKPEFLWWRDE